MYGGMEAVAASCSVTLEQRFGYSTPSSDPPKKLKWPWLWNLNLGYQSLTAAPGAPTRCGANPLTHTEVPPTHSHTQKWLQRLDTVRPDTPVHPSIHPCAHDVTTPLPAHAHSPIPCRLQDVRVLAGRLLPRLRAKERVPELLEWLRSPEAVPEADGGDVDGGGGAAARRLQVGSGRREEGMWRRGHARAALDVTTSKPKALTLTLKPKTPQVACALRLASHHVLPSDYASCPVSLAIHCHTLPYLAIPFNTFPYLAISCRTLPYLAQTHVPKPLLHPHMPHPLPGREHGWRCCLWAQSRPALPCSTPPCSPRATPLAPQVAWLALLSVGAKSPSHLGAALERCCDLLRELLASCGDADVAQQVWKWWRCGSVVRAAEGLEVCAFS
eukprot:365957-Chlamydomonas_euryale.AAC.3